MKKVLKFLLLPIFVNISTLTVNACGVSEQVSNQDIMNSAIGRMQNHTFNMTDLGLSQIPQDQSSYNSLSSTARDKITAYYSDLVKFGGLNWDYPTVAVSVVSDKNLSPFITKYGLDVESKINLTAHLTYKSIIDEKVDIVVKINNDSTNFQKKITAIGKFLENYLDKNKPVFSFKALFKDKLMSNEDSAAYAYSYIESSLRNNLFVASNENLDPVIDIAGIDIHIQGPEKPNLIYSLDSSAITDKKSVTGTLSNLILSIEYEEGGFYHEIKGKVFKIAQSFSDTNNQVATILNQGPQALQFNKEALVDGKLPKGDDMLDKYDESKQFRSKVSSMLFNFINVVYPTDKMKANKAWDASIITVVNASQSRYVKENENRGYFLVNIELNFVIDETDPKNPVVINALVNDLKLNLNDL